MTRLMACALFIAASLTMHAEKPSPGTLAQQSVSRQTKASVSVNYWLYLPKQYSREKKWPLLVFLHGLGERGSDLSLVKKHGPFKYMEEHPEFPFILACPQCPLGEWWSAAPLNLLLNEVSKKHSVDAKRVYLTGLSMGGFGTWDLSLQQPERFAAIAPICGGGNPFLPVAYTEPRLQALRSLPIWVFHGARDDVVLLSESERMITMLKKQGCTNIQCTVYPEANHDSWTDTYNNPKLYEWFLQHSR